MHRILKVAALHQSSAQRVWRVTASLLIALGLIVVGSEKLGPWAQRQIAAGFDADKVKPHLALGNVWFGQHKQDDAAAEYREAIHLNLNNANAYLLQGMVRRIQGKLDDAAAGYREAIYFDPQLATAYYNLGLALRRLAHSSPDALDRARRLRDACGAFMQGASLAPTDPNYPAGMRDIDMLLNGKGRCPSE